MLLVLAQGPQHPHSIFPLQPEPGMHQVVCQFPRTGKQQQAFGVEVQSPHRLPLTLEQLGQSAKHGGTVLWIVVRYHLANGLMVSNDPRRWRFNSKPNRFAIDFDVIAILDTLTDMSRFIVDRYSALHDQLFHLQSRSHPGLGEDFVQFGRFSHRCKHAFDSNQVGTLFIRVKLPRHYIIKAISRDHGFRLHFTFRPESWSWFRR